MTVVRAVTLLKADFLFFLCSLSLPAVVFVMIRKLRFQSLLS
jgi:hypothetical protein